MIGGHQAPLLARWPHTQTGWILRLREVHRPMRAVNGSQVPADDLHV